MKQKAFAIRDIFGDEESSPSRGASPDHRFSAIKYLCNPFINKKPGASLPPGFLFLLSKQGAESSAPRLTLRELWTTTSFVTSVLLTLNFTSVSCKHTSRLESLTVSGIGSENYPTQRHTKGASLSALSSAAYVRENVILLGESGRHKWLFDEELKANSSEVLLRLAAVYRELSSSWTKIYTSYRFFTASDRMKSTTLNHLNSLPTF
jgi:hypothetical protein